MTSVNDSNAFDQWASSYDHDVTDDGRFPFDGYDRVLARILALADVQPGTAVLELGVGTGNLTRLLADRGADVWGLDFSPVMLELARDKVPTATLAQADLLTEFPSGFQRRFPVIVSAYVFHEFPNDEKRTLLQRLVEVHLVPGGRIVIGDIGFADAAARDRGRKAAGASWDEEYYWLADEVSAIAGGFGLDTAVELIASCGLVICAAHQP